MAASTHPCSDGYPDPKVDGEFVSTAIEVGGPYPEKRVIADTRKAKANTEVSGRNTINQPELAAWQQQYPYWLKHQRR